MIKAPRGTFDSYQSEMAFRQDVIDNLFLLSQSYQFEQIQTPIFEAAELFMRSVGDESDIVSKEMYLFEDKKNRQLALRPELTASIARSFIENKLYAQNEQIKFSYYGPAFRYERPQAGRFRQFHQFGVESFGIKNSIHDAEIINLAIDIINMFNLKEQVILKINTLGTKTERENYIKQLVLYFEKYEDDLCEDCKKRLKTNPLRVLDCKIDNQKNFYQNTPLLKDFLNKETKIYFQQVLEYIDKNNIKIEIDNKLVRGLDYYNDVVFEFVHLSSQAQNTIIGGGRYDNLIKELSGPDTPGFGFGLGIERLLEVIKEQNPDILENFKFQNDIYFIPLTIDAFKIAFNSCNKLRFAGLKCVMPYQIKSLKNNLKTANKTKCVYVIIIGEDEIKANYVTVKNLITKQERKIKLSEFENEILKGEHNEVKAN